jgi:hypothetical protein
MHFFHTSRLRTELRNNSLTEQDSVKYMIVASALYTYTTYTAIWFGGYRHWSVLLEALFVTLIGLFGTYECFRANGGDSGRDFIRRFCALSVPVGLKFAIASSLVAQVIYYVAPFVLTPTSFRDPEFVYRFFWLLFNLAMAFGFYWRMVYHITIAARPLTSQPSAA